MKLISIAIASLMILTLSGCVAGTKTQSRFNDAQSHAEQQFPSRLETVAYDWATNGLYRVRITFHRQARDQCWIMTIKDPWSIYDRSYGANDMVWDASECRCSLKECLWIIDRSLSEFRSEKPDARLESFHVEMQVISDLWVEISDGLSRTLSTLDAEKGVDPTDVPNEVGEEMLRVLNSSATIAEIKSLLRKHGIITRAVGTSTPLSFKESLKGRKWSYVAALRGIGVRVPGTVEFDIGSSSCAKGRQRFAQ